MYLPCSFDPDIFHDYKLEKKYDIGFISGGIHSFTTHYPERFVIHERLKKRYKEKYFYAPDPGWPMQHKKDDLGGKKFAKAMNQCKIVINTSGYVTSNHANPKYIEIPASYTVMLADKPREAELLGLKEDYHYIQMTEYDILSETSLISKIDYYLKHEEKLDQICQNGYDFVMEKHSNRQRAKDFKEKIQAFLN